MFDITFVPLDCDLDSDLGHKALEKLIADESFYNSILLPLPLLERHPSTPSVSPSCSPLLVMAWMCHSFYLFGASCLLKRSQLISKETVPRRPRIPASPLALLLPSCCPPAPPHLLILPVDGTTADTAWTVDHTSRPRCVHSGRINEAAEGSRGPAHCSR